MSQYVAYEIQLETKLSSFPGEKLVVDRRYSDFHHLREKLIENHLSVIIPPIPDKDWQNNLFGQSDTKFSKEFLQFRKRQLQNFLQSIANHPKLRESQQFIDFFKTTVKKKNPITFYQIFSKLSKRKF